jgi:hypothetical protein
VHHHAGNFLFSQPNSGGTTDLAFVPFYGRTHLCFKEQKMEPIFKIDQVVFENQEETFPLQEQAVGRVFTGIERPAAEILEAGSTALIFIP